MDNGIFPVTFSGVRPGEAPAVIALIAETGLSGKDLDARKLAHFIVARKEGAIVGAIGLEPVGASALLRSLAVVADQRRQTIASRLVAAIEKYAHSHGVAQLYLLTTTAVNFFVGRGYHRVARDSVPAPIQDTEEFRAVCPDSAVCLEKTL